MNHPPDWKLNMSESMQLLCSTGTFCRDPEHTDYRTILTYGPELEVDGFEVMFYPAWYPQIEQIATALVKSGLHFPAVHAEKSIGTLLGNAQREEQEEGIRRLAANCQLGGLLGAKVLVVHLWGLPELDEQLEQNLQAFNDCLTVAEQFGLQLAVETIPGSRADPLRNVQRAVDQDARCRVALDTEFLAIYHQLDAALAADWLWQGGKVCHVHIKDFDGQPFAADRRRYLHPGEGSIDFLRFFGGLRQRDFAGYVSLEASAIKRDGSVDVKRLQESLALLRRLISC